MGIIKGSVSLTRYRARGGLPGSFWDFADQRLRKFAFREIEETDDEFSAGWVSAGDFLDTGFAYAGYALDPYVVVGLRVDRRQVPGGLIMKYYRLEMKKALAMREGRPLSRSEKEDLKERARGELLRRIPPASSLFEVCWDTSSQAVWLGSSTRWVREVFTELFSATFELDLSPVHPWDQDQEAVELDTMSPITLHAGGA